MGSGAGKDKDQYRTVTQPIATTPPDDDALLAIKASQQWMRDEISRLSDLQKSQQTSLDAARAETSSLRAALRQSECREAPRLGRQSTIFTIGQYNILAGYMGNNMEPWFLYGVNMTEDRRQQILRLHAQRGPDGKPLNAGWPAYVKGVLSPDEIAEVERVNSEVFSWNKRKDRLLEVVRNMDADILSLVECDHYEDHFKAGLAALGYDSTWKQRPRPNSYDGCCVAWMREKFELVADGCIDYVDKYCPVSKRSFKDRIALTALLRYRLTGELMCVTSTHLMRNPENPEMDRLRARQVGQVMRSVTKFLFEHNAVHAPVMLVGDLNATSFGRLRGIANAVVLLQEDTLVHPFTFDCDDVPTGATSVTSARNVRIDAIMYQTQKLELVDVCPVPRLSTADPIPNTAHPSDHVPITATFRLHTGLHMTYQLAREWFACLAGRGGALPLNAAQLRDAFDIVDHDGEGFISKHEFNQRLDKVIGPGVSSAERELVLSKLPDSGADFTAFMRAYCDVLAAGEMPGAHQLKDAFAVFDKDGDGTLELSELLGIFSECAPVEVPEEPLKKLFSRIDTSGDGRICLREFLSHLSSVWVARFAVGETG